MTLENPQMPKILGVGPSNGTLYIWLMCLFRNKWYFQHWIFLVKDKNWFVWSFIGQRYY